MRRYSLLYNGTRLALRGTEVTLGRSRYCSVVIDDEEASREHAAIRVQNETLAIEDLSSRNGTRVNGQKIVGTQSLSIGDVIQVGRSELRIAEGMPTLSSTDATQETASPTPPVKVPKLV